MVPLPVVGGRIDRHDIASFPSPRQVLSLAMTGKIDHDPGIDIGGIFYGVQFAKNICSGGIFVGEHIRLKTFGLQQSGHFPGIFNGILQMRPKPVFIYSYNQGIGRRIPLSIFGSI